MPAGISPSVVRLPAVGARGDVLTPEMHHPVAAHHGQHVDPVGDRGLGHRPRLVEVPAEQDRQLVSPPSRRVPGHLRQQLEGPALARRRIDDQPDAAGSRGSPARRLGFPTARRERRLSVGDAASRSRSALSSPAARHPRDACLAPVQDVGDHLGGQEEQRHRQRPGPASRTGRSTVWRSRRRRRSRR